MEGKLLENRLVIVFDSSRYVVAPQHAVDGGRGAVDAYVAVASDYRVGVSYVVAVVVGEYDAADGADVDAVAFKLVVDFCRVDTGVDKYAEAVVAQIGTVARTPAAE